MAKPRLPRLPRGEARRKCRCLDGSSTRGYFKPFRRYRYGIVREIVEGAPQNLLESVAQLIASTLLSKFSQISVVRVQIRKPHVAVLGPIDYMGIDIIRHRKIDPQS